MLKREYLQISKFVNKEKNPLILYLFLHEYPDSVGASSIGKT
jgi:hypothetical protein